MPAITQKHQNFFIEARDGMQIPTVLFAAENPKAVIQVVHGATEHKELYFEFADYFVGHGYAVIISDQRGHGEMINEKYPYGHMNGIDEMMDDLHRVTLCAKQHYLHLPVYLFGHSLGSVLARCYLQQHDDEIKKLALTGTAQYIKEVNLGLFIGRFITLFSGAYGHSILLHAIGGSTIQMTYDEAKAKFDMSEDEYAALMSNPKRSFAWTNRGALTVFEADSNLKKFARYRCQNRALTIASFTGAEDAFTGGDAGLSDTKATWQKIGYSDITIKQYPGMGHSVLFEPGKCEPYKDLLNYFDRQ